MKKNNFKLALLLTLTIFFSGFTSIYLYNNINLLKDNAVEDLKSFSEELKISAWGWTTAEVVSTESTGDSGSPTIAMDSSGNVHIAWMDYTDYGGLGILDIFYKRWNATTSTWTTTEVVSTESTGDSGSPTIAVDGSGNVHIAWDDWTDFSGSGTDGDIFYKRWDATTSAWTTTEVVSTESTGDSGAPTIAVDGSENVHIAWRDETNYGSSGTDTDIFYKRWDATTSAWTTTEVVSTESTGSSTSPTIAVDGSGNVHIAWEDHTNYAGSGTDTDIFYKRWNAITATWTTTEVVSTESIGGSWDPTIAVGGSGNVHLAWWDGTNYSGSGTDEDIFYKRWNAITATWTTTEVVSTESTGYSYPPTIAVDGSGNVHIAWMDYTDYGGSGTDTDIFYKRWNAITAVWTTIEVVSTESTSQSSSPTIAVDSSGNVHIAYTTGMDISYKKLISTPLNPSIIINSGDASTNSILVNLKLSADGATEMCFRDGITGAWTDWEPYATVKQLDLEGSINNTEYSICVKFRNAIGETTPVCDSILYLGEEGAPFIPGYSAGWIIISLLAGIGVIAILNKSKRIKLRN